MTNTLRLLTIALLMAMSCETNFGQVFLEGRIRNHRKWSDKIFIGVLNDFGSNFKVVDTIGIREDGSFAWRGRIPDSTVIYRLLIPPKNGNANSIVEGFADNYVYLVLYGGMHYYIEADADSLYYSSYITGNAYGEELGKLRDLKKPFYNLAVNSFPQRKKYPDSLAVINKRLMEGWKKEIDIYRSKLRHQLIYEQDAALTLLELYYHYQANFGRYDSVFYRQVMVKDGMENFKIARTLRQQFKNEGYGRKGMVIPNITMKDIYGDVHSTSDMKKDGMYLVNMWASWCRPCRLAHQTYLMDIYRALSDKGLRIISISVDRNEKDWRNAVRTDRTKWSQWLDPQNLGLAAHFQIFAFPTYFIVNSNREIIFEGNNELELKEFLKDYYKVEL